MVMESFHPAVRSWFETRFPAGPTEPQADGWREIAAGRHTLIAAPTGSGKTLAAFLVCIDRIYRAHEARSQPPGTACGAREGAGPAAGPQVVYVSPLKALAVDIWQNLEAPLAEIAGTARRMGLPARTSGSPSGRETPRRRNGPRYSSTRPSSSSPPLSRCTCW